MKISITVTNSIKKDPRVIKQVKCAVAAGHQVQFVGYRDRFLDKEFLDNLDCRYDIVDLGEAYVGHINGLKGKLKRMFWQFFLPIKYMNQFKPDLIHSNDFNTLIYSYIAARKTHAKLVYDSHEIYAENIGIVDSWIKRNFTILVEKILCKRVYRMICVSFAASDYFANKYNVTPPTVITNCPMRNKLPLKPKVTDNFEVVYQGLMVAGRGYEEFVKSAKFLSDDYRLVLRGYGSLEPGLRKLIKDEGLHGKVRFDDPVEVVELISAASESQVGVVLTKPVNLNFNLSVSNKVFEYAHAGLPVILSNVSEHNYLNAKFDFAIVLNQVTPESIAGAIKKLKEDEKLYKRLAHNAILMSETMNWETVSKELLNIYETAK